MTGVKFLVLGAGRMGYAVVYDLIRSPQVEKVFVADIDYDHIVSCMEHFADDRIVPCQLDVNDTEAAVRLMTGADVVISCVTYKHNYNLAKAALEAGVNFVDLGGNEVIVQKEFLLDELARERGISIVPDCGLAPGLVSILAAAAAEGMDELYEIRLRVGGLPTEPEPPLYYSLVFSVQGLINEYMEDATVIRQGKLSQVASLEDVEEIEFPEPFGKLEAFNTSGGLSTLPKTFEGKVQYLNYKTIRYKGHCDQVKLLRDMGLFDTDPVSVNGNKVVPRELMAHLLQHKLPAGEPDVVVLRVTVTGVKDGKPTQVIWEGLDYMDQAVELSAMMRMTAFPASIIAQMIARGDIADKGVLRQETSVPVKLFLAELASRGVKLSMQEKSPVSK